jgi:hypothetical protein
MSKVLANTDPQASEIISYECQIIMSEDGS